MARAKKPRDGLPVQVEQPDSAAGQSSLTGETTYYPELPLELIDAAPDNPRRDLGDLAELVESIKGPAGLVQPPLLTVRDGRFVVVCGHRRHAAARLAGLTSIPALVRSMDDTARKTTMLVENLQRVDLSPIEEARAFAELVGLGWTQRQIAADVGRAQSHVAKRLSLLKLPEEVQAKVDSGGITVSEAVELTQLVDHPERLQRAINSPSSVSAAVERLVEEIDEERELAERVKAIEARGLRVILSASAWYPQFPKDITPIGDGWHQLPLDAAAHESEPCHAVGVLSKSDEFEIPLCTDRARHPDVMTRQERQDQEVAEGETERRREREESQRDGKRRTAFVLDLLKRKPRSPAQALRFLLKRELDYSVDESLAKMLADALGVELHKQVLDEEGGMVDVLSQWSDTAKADQLIQVLVAIEVHRGSATASEQDVALEYLQAQGYELSDRERRIIEVNR